MLTRMLVLVALAAAPAAAADALGPGGGDRFDTRARATSRSGPCRRSRAPTNLPDDPSYVGSSSGLGRPSYYGTTPPPGFDDLGARNPGIRPWPGPRACG